MYQNWGAFLDSAFLRSCAPFSYSSLRSLGELTQERTERTKKRNISAGTHRTNKFQERYSGNAQTPCPKLRTAMRRLTQLKSNFYLITSFCSQPDKLFPNSESSQTIKVFFEKYFNFRTFVSKTLM